LKKVTAFVTAFAIQKCGRCGQIHLLYNSKYPLSWWHNRKRCLEMRSNLYLNAVKPHPRCGQTDPRCGLCVGKCGQIEVVSYSILACFCHSRTKLTAFVAVFHNFKKIFFLYVRARKCGHLLRSLSNGSPKSLTAHP
jgi:hypothetical protein